MRYIMVLPAIVLLAFTGPSFAALDIGESAPDFHTTAAVDGQVFQYSLSDALRKGPVVLYFFPSAFSDGCSIEAHLFAEAVPQYQALGASVIGISRDDIATQKKFSVSECRGKFAVATDVQLKIAQSYDSVMTNRPDYANRISYVIAPDGKILYRYSSLNPDRHVENTLNALREWQQKTDKKPD
jgi:peroxiredoxin Q/BCP